MYLDVPFVAIFCGEEEEQTPKRHYVAMIRLCVHNIDTMLGSMFHMIGRHGYKNPI